MPKLKRTASGHRTIGVSCGYPTQPAKKWAESTAVRRNTSVPKNSRHFYRVAKTKNRCFSRGASKYVG